MHDNYNTVRKAMQPVVNKLDMNREMADALGNTSKAEGIRESIGMIRNGILDYEEKFMNDIRETIHAAYENSFSSYLLIDEIRDFIQEKVEDAKTDAIDSVRYNLEIERDWSESMLEDFAETIEEEVTEIIRSSCLDEGFDI